MYKAGVSYKPLYYSHPFLDLCKKHASAQNITICTHSLRSHRSDTHVQIGKYLVQSAGLCKLIHIYSKEISRSTFIHASVIPSLSLARINHSYREGWAGRFLKQGQFKHIYVDELIWVCLETDRRKFLNISNRYFLFFAPKISWDCSEIEEGGLCIYAIHGQKEVDSQKQQILSFYPRQCFDQCMITHVNFCLYSRACFVNSSKSSSRSRFLGMLPTKRRWLLNDIVTPSFFPFLSSKSFNWKTRICYSFKGLKVHKDIHISISGTFTWCSKIR